MLLIKCQLDWFRESKKAKLDTSRRFSGKCEELLLVLHRVVEGRVEVFLTHIRFNSWSPVPRLMPCKNRWCCPDVCKVYLKN